MPRNAESRKTCHLQSVLSCIKNRLTWWLVISIVPHGDDDQVMTNGATALLRRRLPTRTCHFRAALQHCRDQMEFQENSPMCAVSSSHLVPKLSGIFACTVRSKFLMKLLESNLPTRVAATKDGFTSFHVNTRLVYRASPSWQHRRPIVRKRHSPYDHK